MKIEFELPINAKDVRGRDLPLFRAIFTLDLSRDTLTISVYGKENQQDRQDYAYKLTPLPREPEPPPPERLRQ
jgi:hypothetical protein